MARGISIKAYSELNKSGKAGTQRAQLFAIIAEHKNGLTRNELSRVSGVPINAVCGRVNEMLKSDQVFEGPRRDCRVTGHSAYPLFKSR